MAYSASRKSGLARWSLTSRAVLRESGRVVADVSSLRRAQQICGLLNEAAAGNLPPRVRTDASYRHYKATTDALGRSVVLRAEWRGDVEQVARSADARLLERIADLLERAIRLRKSGYTELESAGGEAGTEPERLRKGGEETRWALWHLGDCASRGGDELAERIAGAEAPLRAGLQD